MCEKCQDTGVRPLTEEEIEEADYDGYDPEDTMIPTTCTCECDIGQSQQKTFWDKWGPIVEQGVKEIDRKYGR